MTYTSSYDYDGNEFRKYTNPRNREVIVTKVDRYGDEYRPLGIAGGATIGLGTVAGGYLGGQTAKAVSNRIARGNAVDELEQRKAKSSIRQQRRETNSPITANDRTNRPRGRKISSVEEMSKRASGVTLEPSKKPINAKSLRPFQKFTEAERQVARTKAGRVVNENFVPFVQGQFGKIGSKNVGLKGKLLSLGALATIPIGATLGGLATNAVQKNTRKVTELDRYKMTGTPRKYM